MQLSSHIKTFYFDMQILPIFIYHFVKDLFTNNVQNSYG